MIVTFSVSNFRSFDDRQTLSLVASESVSRDDNHIVKSPDGGLSVLRTSVVYGANGAGKSNLFRALKLLKRLVLNNADDQARKMCVPFAFAKTAGNDTCLDLQFLSEGTLYRYYIILSSGAITEEALFRGAGGNAALLVRRVSDKSAKTCGIEFGEVLANGVSSPRLEALRVLGVPEHRTFLSAASENISEDELGKDLRAVLKWFNDIYLIGPDSHVGSVMAAYKNEEVRQFASILLDAASGVSQMVMSEKHLSEDELRNLVEKSAADKMLGRSQTPDDSEGIFLKDGKGSEMIVNRCVDGGFTAEELEAVHKLQDGRTGALRLGDESDGTRRLIELIPALYDVIYSRRVCVIDEIERSMHTLLSRVLLSVFLHAGRTGQLILMTHADGLLDSELLRKDEVWFAEKDGYSRTRLYSLNEFRERHRKPLRDYYFEGRYGAIPFGFRLPAREVESVE